MKVLCLNVLANALWYNVPLTLQSLKELNSFEAIFKTWMEMIYTDKKNGKLLYFKKMSDKKVLYCIVLYLLLLWYTFNKFKGKHHGTMFNITDA